ncbi:MAG: ATP-binding protein [Opitutaceae bacterium]|jgi:signal transduction histidine kinase/DNA-binding NarL/FixJ family response regulator
MSPVIHFLDDLPLRVAFSIALHGLALLIVGSLALVLGARSASIKNYEGPRWRWFGWFAIFKGMAVVASLALGVSSGTRTPLFFDAIYVGITLPAWLAGAQFVWTTWRGWLPKSTPWLPSCLWALAVGVAFLWGGIRGFSVLHPIFATTIGVAVLVTLVMEARALERRGTVRGAVDMMLVVAGLGGLLVLEWLGRDYYALMQGWTTNTLQLYAQQKFGVMTAATVCAWALLVGWWLWMRDHVSRLEARGWLRHALWVMPLGLTLMTVTGFMVLNRIKIQGNDRADRFFAQRVKNAAVTLEIAAKSGGVAAYGPVLNQLFAVNSDLDSIVIGRMVNGRLVTVVSTAPDVPLPERPHLWRYGNRTDECFSESKVGFSSSFMQDELGTFTLFCEPCPLMEDGWLMFRVSYFTWGETMGPVIAQATFIIVMAGILVVSAVVFSIQREISSEVRLNFARAEATSRAKSELLARASHELRTPIQGVLGYTDLLERTTLGPRQRGWVEALRNQGKHLLRLVNDLLDFGALQNGRLSIEAKPVSPAEVARDAMSVVRPQAEVNGLVCELTIDETVPQWVLGDATRLRQILVNLLGNAVKFTARGRVDLRVSATGDAGGDACTRLLFSVVDTGPGIAPDDLASLFDPHGRLHRHPAEGAGLGLALSRSLCEAMGGELKVHSEFGHGATFMASVVLPVTAAPESKEESMQVLPVLGLRVLVVEDNTPLRLLMGAWLNELGCTYLLVGDGESALAAARQEHFDAVVLDLGLPGIDGHAVARSLCDGVSRATRPWIVGLSAHAGDADREQALASGMDRFLSKPVGLAGLAAVLRREVIQTGSSSGLLSTRLLRGSTLEHVRATAEEETPVRLYALRIAADGQDWEKVAAMAHYLCNTADVLGAAVLHDACLDCERAAKAGNIERVMLLVQTIERLGAERPMS